MERETYETILTVMADKISYLEWQLKRSAEDNKKLKDELNQAIERMVELKSKGERENAETI